VDVAVVWGWLVDVEVGTAVPVRVLVGVLVGVPVAVLVCVDVEVAVPVAVAVFDAVGVTVGVGGTCTTYSGATATCPCEPIKLTKWIPTVLGTVIRKEPRPSPSVETAPWLTPSR
jgi:hypothetical protein